jgi:hypothetical protein
MTEPNDVQSAVLRALKNHRFALTKADLHTLTGLSLRDVERSIHDLRHRLRDTGETIVAGDDGYLWTGDPAVGRRFVAAMKHREGEIHGTIDDVESSITHMEHAAMVEAGGQARLFTRTEASGV